MSSVLTGARAIFKIKGQDNKLTTVAVASNCSYDWRHNVQPIEVLGRETVAEHTELGMTVEFTCDTFRVADKGAKSLGLMPELGALLTQKEMEVTISDKVSGSTLLSLRGVKMTGRSGAIPARGPWTETLTFVGIIAADEGTANKNDVLKGTPGWPG